MIWSTPRGSRAPPRHQGKDQRTRQWIFENHHCRAGGTPRRARLRPLQARAVPGNPAKARGNRRPASGERKRALFPPGFVGRTVCRAEAVSVKKFATLRGWGSPGQRLPIRGYSGWLPGGGRNMGLKAGEEQLMTSRLWRRGSGTVGSRAPNRIRCEAGGLASFERAVCCRLASLPLVAPGR